MHDRACVAAVQAYAAYDLVRLGKCDPSLALTKRIESITEINEALTHPATAYGDSMLRAILIVIAVDVQSASSALKAEHKVEIVVHVRGLAEMIATRGGLSQLPMSAQVFYYWMDTSTSGMLSAAGYAVKQRSEQRWARTLELAGSGACSFYDQCCGELLDFYATAYTAALREQDSQSLLAALFSVGTNFYSLLSKGVTGRHTVCVMVLLYTNMIIVDCGSNLLRVRNRFRSSAQLVRLLEIGKGTAEALAFALMTAESVRGVRSIDDPARAGGLARCMYAYDRIKPYLQLQVEISLMSFLIADRADMKAVWHPTKLRQLIVQDCNEQ
ncbi:hypothetical protein LTR17_025459 [Elasticomyces elasticus]|nr:hypothetical protein LTR17_025459 [Elasticomyces elasticus]